MKYVVLGRSGITVSRISMGTHHLDSPSDIDRHVKHFLYAYKKGINFFETSVTPAGEKRHGKHPTQKPVQLLEKFVKLLTNENDVVFDPFCGSGSSGVAALQMNRRFIGSEISEEYCKLSEERFKEVDKN